MRLVVARGDTRIELSAKSTKDMDRLCDMAAAIVAAMPDEESKPDEDFGFTVASTIETEIAEDS